MICGIITIKSNPHLIEGLSKAKPPVNHAIAMNPELNNSQSRTTLNKQDPRNQNTRIKRVKTVNMIRFATSKK